MGGWDDGRKIERSRQSVYNMSGNSRYVKDEDGWMDGWMTEGQVTFSFLRRIRQEKNKRIEFSLCVCVN